MTTKTSKQFVIQPWKDTCKLRPEIRERKLTASDFAVDLYKVVNGWPGQKPFYCDPVQFFSATYATQNLRQFCKVVLRRLAGLPGGESIINIAQTFGGGKTHTETTLHYLTTLGSDLPRGSTAVGTILNEAQLSDPPQARVAAVSFDKVDWVKGCQVKSPSGEKRSFRMPWNLIAWQLLGQRGIEILARDESQPDFDTPPADTLWAQVLSEVEAAGTGALILIDEFLMWAHDAASPDPTGQRQDRGPFWYDRFKNFFQRLSQAVEASSRSCLVVSLLATEPQKNDDVGKAILSACNNGLNRQASLQSPVEKDDLAELLRQRLFEKFPENPADREKHIAAFWPRMKAVDGVRAKLPDSLERLKMAYPFHPDLLDRFFGKWTDLDQFQRTRGVLQTFAMALRDAENWDESPVIGPQVFLEVAGKDGLSEALLKLAEAAKDSDRVRNPQWPSNLKTELPRALEAQKTEAATLTGREIEAACVAAFVFSQPIGDQADLSDLRWLLAPTCELPPVLNNGLIAWSKASWFLEECDATEAGTGVPKFWRLGPTPNLNQLHDTYKKRELKHAKSKFDEIAKDKCPPLYEGLVDEGVKPHKLPDSPSDVEDDGQFRIVVLGADYSGVVGDPPPKKVEDYIRTHSSPSDIRTYQNVVLIAIPSATGLHQAEQQVAEWLGWEAIENSDKFAKLESSQQKTVRDNKRATLKAAQTAVKNAYELVTYLDKDGSIQAKKITMGAQSLFATLLQEPLLRIFREKIDAEAIMPLNALYPVWPASDSHIRVADLYQQFGRDPRLPKLLSAKTVLNTIEDAVERGVLAVRCVRSDQSEVWFWRSAIDVAGWEKTGEAWLPAQATLNALSSNAVLPDSLPGLWPTTDSGVKLSELYSWFDGSRCYEEALPGYPPESRPIPKVDYAIVKKAVTKAIQDGKLWLVYGNDSVFGEAPAAVQLDADALLFRPPEPLAAIDLLPAALPDAWSKDAEPKTTVAAIYAELKTKRGRPWPPKLFLDSLNAALGQGFIHRASGRGPIGSLQHDGNVDLTIRVEAPKPPEPQPTPTPAGRRASSLAILGISEVQDLADQIHALAKPLAGMDPQVEVRITVKTKPESNFGLVNSILDKIKVGWRF
ncbi:MAG TPA: DUF499 domain-containing protein [Bryobacteraceae bacterium]|nr:DUF499 domain-containing protein [Bryobacteraceae bacterium]